jgi:hypothetical protein
MLLDGAKIAFIKEKQIGVQIQLAIWVQLKLRERRLREVQDATRGLLEGFWAEFDD